MMGGSDTKGEFAVVDSDNDTDNSKYDGDDSGIIPRLCKDLLSAVQNLKPQSEPLTKSEAPKEGGERVIEAYMRAAYYEIYNEKVYDLLASDYEVPRKIREHATEGAFVEGLTYSRIQTYEDIESTLAIGKVRA